MGKWQSIEHPVVVKIIVSFHEKAMFSNRGYPAKYWFDGPIKAPELFVSCEWYNVPVLLCVLYNFCQNYSAFLISFPVASCVIDAENRRNVVQQRILKLGINNFLGMRSVDTHLTCVNTATSIQISFNLNLFWMHNWHKCSNLTLCCTNVFPCNWIVL